MLVCPVPGREGGQGRLGEGGYHVGDGDENPRAYEAKVCRANPLQFPVSIFHSTGHGNGSRAVGHGGGSGDTPPGSSRMEHVRHVDM